MLPRSQGRNAPVRNVIRSNFSRQQTQQTDIPELICIKKRPVIRSLFSRFGAFSAFVDFRFSFAEDAGNFLKVILHEFIELLLVHEFFVCVLEVLYRQRVILKYFIVFCYACSDSDEAGYQPVWSTFD